MNIETVAENLRNTIAGKEMLLAQIKEDLPNINDQHQETLDALSKDYT